MKIEYRTPKFTRSGSIRMEINHPQYGWIPFSASPDDPEEHGRALYEAAKDEAAPYVEPEPEPEPVPRVVTRRQGKQQLVVAGLDEQVEAAIDGIEDATERKLTRIWYDDAETWERDNEQLAVLSQALGLSDDEVDALFVEAAKL